VAGFLLPGLSQLQITALPAGASDAATVAVAISDHGPFSPRVLPQSKIRRGGPKTRRVVDSPWRGEARRGGRAMETAPPPNCFRLRRG